jgi:hypothetical protein
MAKDNEALLKEIREEFDYYSDAWREILDEGRDDMQYLSGDPWTQAEKDARENAGRPIVSFDELTQYVNQIINDVRMNKRSIKVTPVSEDATDKTAEAREKLIRGIEYESNAQAAYTTAFEGAVQRGYGFIRVKSEYASAKGFNQVLRIKRIPNPDTVLMDPMCKEADCSDAEGCFVIDVMTLAQFKRKYPKAEKKSFDADDRKMAPNWIKGDSITVAEYWKVKKTSRMLLMLDDQGTTAYLDEIEGAKLQSEGDQEFIVSDGKRTPIVNSRKCEEREVCQYVTNGLEILETNPEDKRVQYIPIIPCFGKEMFVDDGGGSKRILMSLIRLARSPYKMYCFLRAQEAEEATMTPRVPWMLYEGQAEGHEDEFNNAHNTPIAYLQVKPVIDSASGQVLPLPTRPQFQPNFEAYEIACEAMKRAIQSACGMYNTAVGKHDTNVKSGVALKALDSQSSQGNFHFIDNYDRCLQHVGRVIDERIPVYYDTPRQVGLRKPDESHEIARVNDPNYVPDGQQEAQHIDLLTGEHDVTVSTGPSFNSQREEASAFNEALIGNIADLPISPEQKTQLLALGIKLKQLGPIGDQMVEVLTPDPNKAMDPRAQQAISQAQLEAKALNAHVRNLRNRFSS